MSLSKQPLILISNDDSIYAQGIQVLTRLMSAIGRVVVVAPEKPHSGMGHAITQDLPLRITSSNIFNQKNHHIEAYMCSGTPADCIITAQTYILKHVKPDLIVSGINHGKNTAISILYSGTMAAAIEGALDGVPAIGFSLNDISPNADFTHTEKYIVDITKKFIQHKIIPNIALNVNFPSKQQSPIRGIKICRQADVSWEKFLVKKKDPRDREYFWLNGKYYQEENRKDTDEWAIAHNYVSIVPCQYDLTAYSVIPELQDLWSK